MGIAPAKLKDEYLRLRAGYFVFGNRTREQAGRVQEGLFVLKFDIPKEYIRNGLLDKRLPVWGRLPLNDLREVFYSPEDGELVLPLIYQHKPNVTLTEIEKNFKPRFQYGQLRIK